MNHRLFNILLKEYSLTIEDYNFLNSNLSIEDVIKLEKYKDKFEIFKNEILKIKDKRILVFGDFDADGIISTTIMYSLLKEIGVNVSFKIPIKSSHGYGIKKEDITPEFDAYICVDNGVKAIEAIEEIKKQGKVILILDHHAYETLPIEENKVLHPVLLRDKTPFSAGYLTYLFYAYFNKKHDHYFFALGATSLISDVIDINNSNRFVLRFLDNLLNKEYFRNIALFERYQSVKCLEQISNDFVTYLNAITRMDVKDQNIFNQLIFYLSDRNKFDLDFSIVNILKDLNNLKKEEVKTIYDFIPKTESKYVITKLEAKEGLTGLIANKILTTDKKELVAVFSKIENSCLKGSIRTLNEMNLLSILKEDFIIDGGGHEKAVGLTIKEENFDRCKTFLENLKPTTSRKISLEDEINFNELDADYFKTYYTFTPIVNNIAFLKIKIKNFPKKLLTFSKDLKHTVYKVTPCLKINIFGFGKDEADAYPNDYLNLEANISREYWKDFLSYNLNCKIIND